MNGHVSLGPAQRASHLPSPPTQLVCSAGDVSNSHVCNLMEMQEVINHLA